MKSRILEKMWEIVFVAPSLLRRTRVVNGETVVEHVRGDCDPPNKKGKTIRIAKNLPPREELEVIIHECLHAADWHKDEETWITPVADDIARVIWKAGWRKMPAD